MNQKRDIGITINPWPKTLDHYSNAASSGRVKRGPATAGSDAGWPCVRPAWA
ncbi:hypothetical protein [Glaciecola sp. 1036]|uniref:hypothetical protein n=1 Tax=Alteromonadaceae TaxID=72275 RepID=UPI003D066E47